MRLAFTKHDGSLGEPGSVAWIFEKRGVVTVDGARYGEDDVIAAIDAGAEDVSEDGDLLRVLCEPSALSAVREALEAAGVEIQSAEVTMEPKSTVEVGKGDAKRAARPARRARRARRRQRGPRQLRHPRGGPRPRSPLA